MRVLIDATSQVCKVTGCFPLLFWIKALAQLPLIDRHLSLSRFYFLYVLYKGFFL